MKRYLPQWRWICRYKTLIIITVGMNSLPLCFQVQPCHTPKVYLSACVGSVHCVAWTRNYTSCPYPESTSFYRVPPLDKGTVLMPARLFLSFALWLSSLSHLPRDWIHLRGNRRAGGGREFVLSRSLSKCDEPDLYLWVSCPIATRPPGTWPYLQSLQQVPGDPKSLKLIRTPLSVWFPFVMLLFTNTYSQVKYCMTSFAVGTRTFR